MTLVTRVLTNQYHDSVVLMLAAKELKQQTGVLDAAYMMGTDVNKDLLQTAGLLDEIAKSAHANDLIIVVKSEGESPKLLDFAESLLSTHRSSEKTSSTESETLRSVIHTHPDANMVLISIAGAYAAREAREAVASGCHVFLFSDNVSLNDEIALKRLAVQRGLLLMGPGAGTAIINGVGLGFANQVPKGNIGIISAAGTGLQEVSTLLAKKGLGISQAIGTGGRDLSKEIGGLMFFSAVDALQADPDTKLIVLISKLPDQKLVEQLTEKIKDSQKPIVLCLLGAERPPDLRAQLHFTRTLEECALVVEQVINVSKQDVAKIISDEDDHLFEKFQGLTKDFSPEQKYIRGLFSGGTLCYEAQVIWRDMLADPVYSNAPLTKDLGLQYTSSCTGHCALDLGEEEFTVGRPHPMIDNELRIERMIKDAEDPQTAIILFDTVIGYGAHPDPGKEIGEAIKTIRRKHPEVIWVTSITGTAGDPQGLSKTSAELEEAGVIVCDSNAQAARLAANLLGQ